MNRLTLRAATAADAEFLGRVYASTRREELAMTGWSDEQKEQFCRAQFHAQTTHYLAYYPTAEQCIVERNGIPAGRLYVERLENKMHVLDVALLPEHRRAGLGTRLLRDLQREAAGAGQVLTIHVEQLNPARHLYERLGFTMVEEQGVYFLLEWRAGEDSRPGS